MHKNNAKAAVEFWALVDGGMSIKDATKLFHFKNNNHQDSDWSNFLEIGSLAPNFSSIQEVRKKPANWDLMQEYEQNAKDNALEHLNWIEFIPAKGWFRCSQKPDFNHICKEFVRLEMRKELLDLIAQYKEEPNEWKKWEWMHPERTKGKWKPWERDYTIEESFLRDDGTQYRRKPDPVPDANGRFTIDSLLFHVPVDLYNKKDKFDAQIDVIVTLKYEKEGELRFCCSGYCVSATPTPAQEPAQKKQDYSIRYNPYKIEIISNGVKLKDQEFNELIGEELDHCFASDVFKAFGFDKNEGWKKWQFRRIGNDSWVSWDKDFDAIGKCWREGYTYRINPNLK